MWAAIGAKQNPLPAHIFFNKTFLNIWQFTYSKKTI